MIALVLAVASMGRDSTAQTAKESIYVPPRSRLLLRAVGSGDQIYGCVNGNWALKAPDVGGTGRLAAVRFIQRTGTRGGNAPDGSCSQSAMRRVPYTATYSFYEPGQ